MFFHQTFDLVDIPKILILVFLECVLSADNAIIMAMVVQPLPEHQRGKALWTGAISAVVLRILAILGIAYLVHILWIRIIGAAYLLYLALSYGRKKKPLISFAKPIPMWKVVIKLEFFDIIFALDSILAALGFMGISLSTAAQTPPKLWIIYVAATLGLLLMRFASHGFSLFLQKLPKLEKAAHYILGLVGLKLGLESFNSYFPIFSQKLLHYGDLLFWLALLSLFLYGLLVRGKKT
ncbi:MAG: hypothetical protein FJZ63_02680 [Chlamydiae bacterium]|nr:hypothetical protein [Chlamydiota bacterium]